MWLFYDGEQPCHLPTTCPRSKTGLRSGLSEEGGRRKEPRVTFWRCFGRVMGLSGRENCELRVSNREVTAIPPDVQGRILRARGGDADKGTTIRLSGTRRIFWEQHSIGAQGHRGLLRQWKPLPCACVRGESQFLGGTWIRVGRGWLARALQSQERTLHVLPVGLLQNHEFLVHIAPRLTVRVCSLRDKDTGPVVRQAPLG